MKWVASYFFLCTSLIGSLYGGGFSLSEVASPGLGTAGVGQAVVAQDASTAYFNPAGMTYLWKKELLLGAQVNIEDIRFEQRDQVPFSGRNGGQAGYTLPQGAAYLVLNPCRCLRLGLSINSPYWSAINYDDPWTGRYFVQKMVLVTADVTPTVALKVCDWLSVGGGIIMEFAGIQMNTALNPDFFAGDQDGKASYNMDNWGYGYMGGFIFEPCGCLRIGAMYRSKIFHRFHIRQNFRPETAVLEQSNEYNFPQSVNVSVRYMLNNWYAFLFDYGWENYNNFDTRMVSTLNGNQEITERKWRDTRHAGIALQVAPGHRHVFQFGVAYDTSPTNRKTHTPDYPIDRIIRVGAGWIFACNACESVSMACEFADYGKARMHNDLVKGEYKVNHRFFVNATWSRKF